MQFEPISQNYLTFTNDGSSKMAKNGKTNVYKTSSYQCITKNTSPLDKSFEQNVNQLDTLLEDLKNERQITEKKDFSSFYLNQKKMEHNTDKPTDVYNKTSDLMTTIKQPIEIENLNNIDNISTTNFKALKYHEYVNKSDAGKLNTSIDKKNQDNLAETEKKFNIYENNSSFLENTDPAFFSNSSTAQYLEKDLKNIVLSNNILPTPGTKVTTTVRTYTYEIPHEKSERIPNNCNQVDNGVSYKSDSGSSIQIHPNIYCDTSDKTIYGTQSYSISRTNNEIPSVSNDFWKKKKNEQNNTINNNNSPYLPSASENKTDTITYNVKSLKNTNIIPESNKCEITPEHLHPACGSLSFGNYSHGPTNNIYFYKEYVNEKSSMHGQNTHDSDVLRNVLSTKKPQKLSDKTSPTQKSSISVSGKTDLRVNVPNLQPSLFPINGENNENSMPPQRIDDLMLSFENDDYVDRLDVSSHLRKREIETGVATSTHIPTVNKVGKEIYYPPGHEKMLLKSEEMAAGSASEGRWAKGSGMYEYESDIRSKTKTKSGTAVVPVCLPLCCAMPCSIM